MPLSAYGVCIGTLKQLDPSDQGEWFHGRFTVVCNEAGYLCTVDLENALKAEVQYDLIPVLRNDLFENISSLSDGYHPLASTSSSGALDYIRSSFLTAQGCITVWWQLWNRVFGTNKPWVLTTGEDAATQLAQQISAADVRRLYVFGQPFTQGLGMHNVHMNQGDPVRSSDGVDHQPDDGIWQDGGTILQHADGTLSAFLTKFSQQSLNTNEDGLPI